MEKSWEMFNNLISSENINESNKLPIDDDFALNKDELLDNSSLNKDELSNNLLKECYKLLKETKELQLDLINSIDLLKTKETEVIVSKDKNYSQHLRESNRAWRLYGNYYKPILPIIYTGLYSGINNNFLNNADNADNVDNADKSDNADNADNVDNAQDRDNNNE